MAETGFYPDPASREGEEEEEEEIMYPDIDETVQYPWQGGLDSQQPTSSATFAQRSALDPRLYRDLFPGEVINESIIVDGDDYDEDRLSDVDEASSASSEEYDQFTEVDDESDQSYQEDST